MGRPENPISRREFIKVAFGGLAVLAEMLGSREALAKLEKLLVKREFIRESFEAGLERLRDEVFESPTERFYVFVKKGGIEGWLNIEAEKTYKKVVSIELMEIYNDAEIEEVRFVHTHPLEFLIREGHLDGEEAETIRNKKVGRFPMMPSATDLLVSAAQHNWIAKSGTATKIYHYVLDPSGIWYYYADPKNPWIKQAMENAEKRGKYEVNLKTDKPEEVGRSLYRLHTDIEFRQKELYEAGKISKNNINLKEFQKRWGVILNYEPYEETE